MDGSPWDPVHLHDGHSMRYGLRKDGAEHTWYDLTVFDDGTVAVYWREGRAVLDREAFRGLVQLYCKATGRALAASPGVMAEFREEGGDILGFVNALLKAGRPLDTVTGTGDGHGILGA